MYLVQAFTKNIFLLKILQSKYTCENSKFILDIELGAKELPKAFWNVMHKALRNKCNDNLVQILNCKIQRIS